MLKIVLELLVENDHFIIQKVCRLEELLAQITPENIHSGADTSSAVGEEIW